MRRTTLALACAYALVLSSCAGHTGRSAGGSDAAAVPELKPGIPAGYLGRALPDSLALLPPPPVEGSPAFVQDQAIHAAAQALRDGPRGAMAKADADLGFPQVAKTFECALGRTITKEETPRLFLLLQRTMVDAGLATYAAKNHYQRQRPFVHFNEATCRPEDEAELRTDGSYPSGHTAVGWAWGLVLVEIAPDRADALLARARAFGESRLVCNAHWQSDVLAGRTVAAASVAKLHADAVFLADVAAAREEMQQAAVPDASKCAAEAALLAPLPGTL